MFELFVASDAARRKVREGFEPAAPRRPETLKGDRPRRAAVRSTSAAALRRMADRLEPSTS